MNRIQRRRSWMNGGKTLISEHGYGSGESRRMPVKTWQHQPCVHAEWTTVRLFCSFLLSDLSQCRRTDFSASPTTHITHTSIGSSQSKPSICISYMLKNKPNSQWTRMCSELLNFSYSTIFSISWPTQKIGRYDSSKKNGNVTNGAIENDLRPAQPGQRYKCDEFELQRGKRADCGSISRKFKIRRNQIKSFGTDSLWLIPVHHIVTNIRLRSLSEIWRIFYYCFANLSYSWLPLGKRREGISQQTFFLFNECLFSI